MSEPETLEEPEHTVPPFVYVVMPTTNKRRHLLPRALKRWAAQDYPHLRVLILDGGTGIPYDVAKNRGETVDDLVPSGGIFEYCYVHEKVSLGEKYNRGFARSSPDMFLLCAGDDDWVSHELVSYLAHFIFAAGVSICGGVSMFAFRETDRKLFLYAAPYNLELTEDPADPEGDMIAKMYEPYTIGGLTLFHRRHWEGMKFPDVERGSDTIFVRNLLANGHPEGGEIQSDVGVSAVSDSTSSAFVRIYAPSGKPEDCLEFIQFNEPRLYVAMVHGDNTGNPLAGPDVSQEVWTESLYDVRAFMGEDDAAEFGIVPHEPIVADDQAVS